MKKFINAIILAFTSCAGNIAANIAKDCDNPQVGGYTGRGLLIPLSNTLTFAVDASNPRIITGITMAYSGCQNPCAARCRLVGSVTEGREPDSL